MPIDETGISAWPSEYQSTIKQVTGPGNGRFEIENRNFSGDSCREIVLMVKTQSNLHEEILRSQDRSQMKQLPKKSIHVKSGTCKHCCA